MILLFLLFFLPQSWAENFKSYRIGKLVIIFHQVEKTWVNKSCKNDKCLALSKWKKFKDVPISADYLVGGKNPFAVRCKTLMEGQVVIGVDKKGNEQSLCRFSDDSFLK